jgi:hypothetical protein
MLKHNLRLCPPGSNRHAKAGTAGPTTLESLPKETYNRRKVAPTIATATISPQRAYP